MRIRLVSYFFESAYLKDIVTLTFVKPGDLRGSLGHFYGLLLY